MPAADVAAMDSLLDKIKAQSGIIETYRNGVAEYGLIPPPKTGPKILLYDIETLPMITRAWRPYKATAVHIQQPTLLLCFAYKWEGHNGIGFEAMWHADNYQPGDLPEIWPAVRLASLFDTADITIAHNGDRFDRRKANGVFDRLGLLPPSTYQTIDPLKVARRELGHDKNSLDHLADIYGLKRKLKHHGIELWLNCEAGDPDAQAEMELYNRRDVEVLEGVYHKLLPWMGLPGKPAHPNLGHWAKGERVCTNCGSDQLTTVDTPHRALVSEWEVFRCGNCGAQSRGRLRKSQKGGIGVKSV